MSKLYTRVAETSLRRVAVGELVCEGVTASARETLDRPRRVETLAHRLLQERATEAFLCFGLDAHHGVIAHWFVSTGDLTTCLVSPRGVFGPALRLGTVASVVVAHNHPTGNPEPSTEDLSVTKRLSEAGKLLGVPLLDHVIVGDGRHVSLRERGLIS